VNQLDGNLWFGQGLVGVTSLKRVDIVSTDSPVADVLSMRRLTGGDPRIQTQVVENVSVKEYDAELWKWN